MRFFNNNISLILFAILNFMALYWLFDVFCISDMWIKPYERATPHAIVFLAYIIGLGFGLANLYTFPVITFAICVIGVLSEIVFPTKCYECENLYEYVMDIQQYILFSGMFSLLWYPLLYINKDRLIGKGIGILDKPKTK